MDVKKKAAVLIKRYHTDDPAKIAVAMGIKIIYGDLGGVNYGSYIKYNRAKLIILDSNRMPASMLPFVTAHELGHAVCTPDANTAWMRSYTMAINADIVEHAANQFAVELLLNDRYLQDNPGCSIYQLAQTKGIPSGMIRLKNFKQ